MFVRTELGVVVNLEMVSYVTARETMDMRFALSAFNNSGNLLVDLAGPFSRKEDADAARDALWTYIDEVYDGGLPDMAKIKTPARGE